MRFSVLSVITALVAVAFAEDTTTDIVTKYETYCPEAAGSGGWSSVPAVTPSASVSAVTPPSVATFTSGSVTVIRPVSYSVATYCNSCPSSTPVASFATSFPASFPASFATSSPSKPTPPASSNPAVPPNSVVVTPSPLESVSPLFTGGAAHHAAGAGAGLATLFGLVAFLL